MPILWAASVRHLLRHPAQLVLALLGLSVGVGTIIAVDIATASSGRAFQLSSQAVNGAATHEIVGGPQGVDERVYVDLRTREGGPLPAGAVGVRPPLAPVVDGYVIVGERTMQLIGIDPLADPDLNANGGDVRPASGDPTRWFTQPGAVVMGASAARQLGRDEIDGVARKAIAIGIGMEQRLIHRRGASGGR